MLVPASAQESGWHYSPLPGEGDRASMGCGRDNTPEAFTCLVVRCEDDFSTGIHIHTSRAAGGGGAWEMTVDRETRVLAAKADGSPYAARFADPDGWLLERLRQGTFVYLRHENDAGAPYVYIDLAGSLAAINEALHWCAPRLPAIERTPGPDVDIRTNKETDHEPPPPGSK